MPIELNTTTLPHRRQFLRLVAGGSVMAAVPQMARAQAYPTRPIRLVIPASPGGGYDAIGRPLAEKMKGLLGTIIVENVAGGGGSLGAAAVARAPPDGYTILLGGSVPYVNEALLKKRPLYDPFKDLDPIANVAVACNAILIHPSVPAQSLNELIAHARAKPGTLSYAHIGIGSGAHITGEQFKTLVQLPDIAQIPYRGAGPAIADLISGHVPMAVVAATGQVFAFHRAGNLRVLAVTNPTRLAAAPELPTTAEAGYPDLTAQGFFGLHAPARTPRPIIDQIAEATRAAVADQEFQQFLIKSGFEPIIGSTPEKFRQELEDIVTRYRPIVEALGLRLD